MTDLIWSFSPWFVFLLASRFVSFSGAVALGFMAAIVVLVRAASEHHVHMLDVVSPCYFAALAVALMERRKFTDDQFRELHPGGSLGKALIHEDGTVVTLRAARVVPSMGAQMVLTPVATGRVQPAGPWD